MGEPQSPKQSPAAALQAENEALKKQLQQLVNAASFGEEWSTRDPVHGAIGIPVILKKIIDTKIFQRLRRIKQTSMCEFLYDGATHTRFEHSIGVCYLAFTQMEKIRKKYPEKATVREIRVSVL
jgi:HD superfamily phosphohydrolase